MQEKYVRKYFDNGWQIIALERKSASNKYLFREQIA